MEFLRPGDMTLFICFVRFLPLPLHFGISVHTGRGRGTECFCGTVAHAESFGNNRLIEEKAAAADFPCFVPAGGALLSHSLRNEPVFPPACHPDGSDHYLHLLCDRAGSERCNTMKSAGGGGGQPAWTRFHTCRKTPSLIIITFYEHSTQ